MAALWFIAMVAWFLALPIVAFVFYYLGLRKAFEAPIPKHEWQLDHIKSKFERH